MDTGIMSSMRAFISFVEVDAPMDTMLAIAWKLQLKLHRRCKKQHKLVADRMGQKDSINKKGKEFASF
jgi:hypothetical protein